MVTINEPGLYRLIFSSTKPEAEDFKRWVFRELLPSLRKYGYYRLPGRSMPRLQGKGSWGRQPFLDELRRRGISQAKALKTMNELEHSAPLIKSSSYGNQMYGACRANDALVLRASMLLGKPPEKLFTSWRGCIESALWDGGEPSRRGRKTPALCCYVSAACHRSTSLRRWAGIAQAA